MIKACSYLAEDFLELSLHIEEAVATFVHITDERDARSIERNGLKLPKVSTNFTETDLFKHGVFTLPVIENFVVSH